MSRDYQRDLHRRNVKILRFASFGNVLDTEKILEISRKISYGNPLGELTFHLSKKVILIILEIVLIGKCPSLVLTLEVKPLSVELPVKVRLGLESINIDNNWVVRRKRIHRGI